MVGQYESFFPASAGASAAILGLLIVAVSVVNADDENATTRELRTVLAVMAAIGLLPTRELIPRAKRAGNFARTSRTRGLNLAFAAISVVGYSVQLGLGVALLADTHSAALQRALVLVIVVFYGSALGRAWVVAGIARR